MGMTMTAGERLAAVRAIDDAAVRVIARGADRVIVSAAGLATAVAVPHAVARAIVVIAAVRAHVTAGGTGHVTWDISSTWRRIWRPNLAAIYLEKKFVRKNQNISSLHSPLRQAKHSSSFFIHLCLSSFFLPYRRLWVVCL